MKTIEKLKPGTHNLSTTRSKKSESEEIQPDYPLSEKDEVKQAEAKMLKRAKKHL
jgi:hypothetical protein